MSNPWWYEIPEDKLVREIATYRATPAGGADARTDTELRPYAVNTIIAREAPTLARLSRKEEK